MPLGSPASAPSPAADRIAACRELLPGLPRSAAFSHFTAAALWGFWVPRVPSWLPWFVTVPPGTDRVRHRDTYVARSRAALATTERDGLPVLAPAAVIGQLAEDLPLLDLVVAIDGVLQSRLCTPQQIWAAVAPRQRGRPRLRRAMRLSDGRSQSPGETALRLLHVSAGIAVTPQFAVHDETGRIVAAADLSIDGTDRLPEYDGACHRDHLQHHRDLRRERLLQRLGYQRYGYALPDIRLRPGDIIRDAESALGLPHDPARLKGWAALVGESTLDRWGRRRFEQRLQRFLRE